ncbi:MAG: 3-hydroxyacyl-CoA dehydrogenase NAD-binding domain-containing protein, partial [Desulfuromonadales bacterium]|nr:3-hydroxyacyl-CoA dehydrogenase NAD-binding domain-containing protein [Desulfuromonadales bacterium]
MKQLQTIGVVGGGLIGMSWASLFLARGMTVVVVEPRPEAEAQLHQFVAEAWPKLQALGLTTSDSVRRAEVSSDFSRLGGVDFVQENGPDRIEIKHDLVRQLERVIDPAVPIVSSTSSLLASELQSGAKHPERILVGHPM